MTDIKYLVMDVDGTLTDGKIYMGQAGEVAKAFDIKDGCGILLVLPQHDITPIIITARESRILERRCRELQISELHQGVKNKLAKLKQIVGDDLGSVAYAGDDLPDIPCMEAVKDAGGIVVCPSDAIPEIKALADYISGKKAGEGAIRDCINYLVQESLKDNMQERIDRVIDLILRGNYTKQTQGVLADGTPYTIQEYTTKEEKDCMLESHRSHIDVQYMLSGQEYFKLYSEAYLTNSEEYNAEKDVEIWKGGIVKSNILMKPGSIVVVMNNQPHKGAIRVCDSEIVRKMVCKIDV